MKQSSFSSKKALEIVGKVISWAVFVILLIAAIFLFYYFIATKIYAAKGPGYEPKFSIYTIISGSMEPKIKVYDTVINVRVNDPSEIKKGDVITFISSSSLSNGTTITHRVKKVITDEDGKVCYVTRGDNNPIDDQACAKYQNVLGKVIIKIPQLGRIQFFLASKAGWLICILIPALVVIVRDVMKIMKLSVIKNKVASVNEENKVDEIKVASEQSRKDELKRRLLRENMNVSEYYSDPVIEEIDKRKPKPNKKEN